MARELKLSWHHAPQGKMSILSGEQTSNVGADRAIAANTPDWGRKYRQATQGRKDTTQHVLLIPEMTACQEEATCSFLSPAYLKISSLFYSNRSFEWSVLTAVRTSLANVCRRKEVCIYRSAEEITWSPQPSSATPMLKLFSRRHYRNPSCPIAG